MALVGLTSKLRLADGGRANWPTPAARNVPGSCPCVAHGRVARVTRRTTKY